MKFSVLCGDLHKILVKTGSVIPSKSTLPILENYLFTLKNDSLTITATDLDISISSTLKVKGEQDGSIVIPSKRLMDTIRSLPNINVNFSADPNSYKILMQTEKGEYRLTGQSYEEYPTIQVIKNEDEIKIETDILKRLINKTLFAASVDELRPAMTGVFFQFKQNEVRAVATDGHRLVKLINTNFNLKNSEHEIIIPSKTLNIISKHFEEKIDSIFIEPNQVSLIFGETILVSKLIDEKYPNYESVIPGDNNQLLSVNKNELLSSVRRTSFYASSTTHQIRFSITKNSLTVSAEDIDFGSEAKENILCEYNDNDMDIGFNANYIIDILSHIDSDEIEFLLSGPNRAAMLKPKVKNENEDMLMLVMPVRLNT